MPGSGDWEFTLALAGAESRALDYLTPAQIALVDGTTGAPGSVAGLMMMKGATAPKTLQVATTTWAGGSFVALGTFDNIHNNEGYLRVKKVGTTYSWSFSTTGKRWTTIYSGSLGFTPGRVLIGGKTQIVTSGDAPVGVFKWFRRTA